MMNGLVAQCNRAVEVDMDVEGKNVMLDCLTANIVPGFDLLLGMDAVERLGGIQVSRDGRNVKFLGGEYFAAMSMGISIDDKDFSAQFRDSVDG
jgi:hypothetical protein